MGCFGSRFSKRAAESDDLNTVGLQFVGGEAHAHDGAPCDIFVLSVLDADKKPQELAA